MLAVEEGKLKKVHDFVAYGRLGGRPLRPKELARGVAGGESSNRLGAGQERRRIEITALEGKQMCEYMKSKKLEYVDLHAFWRDMMIRYKPMQKHTLHNILSNEED